MTLPFLLLFVFFMQLLCCCVCIYLPLNHLKVRCKQRDDISPLDTYTCSSSKSGDFFLHRHNTITASKTIDSDFKVLSNTEWIVTLFLLFPKCL